MWNYKTEDEALIDVLRLSKGMTYKAAAAGLNLGGGKAVIIGDPKLQKNEALFRAFGHFVNSLNGKYITAEDVNTCETDMEYVFMETPWVTGIPKSLGGSGDPSPYTAHGVLMGMKAAAKEKLGTENLKGMVVAVQGLGNVGSHLVKYLVEEGAVVKIADIEKDRVQNLVSKYRLEAIHPEEIITTHCDILAPCALGAIINDQTLPKLRCKVVAGGANNQLAENRHGDALRELGILYAPDYVINAGGLMNVFVELEGYSIERAFDKTKKVFDNMTKVFEIAKKDNIGTHTAADRLAESRILSIGNLRRRHQGKSSRQYTTLKEVFNR
jgi:leucine dehydrogenase